MAVVGGLTGALLGAAAWWACSEFGGIKIGYVAWGVGVAAGFGVVLLGRWHGGTFPIIGAATALIGILVGEYLIYRSATVDVSDRRVLRALMERGFSEEQARELLPRAKAALAQVGVIEYFKTEFPPVDLIFIALAVFSGWKIPGLEGVLWREG